MFIAFYVIIFAIIVAIFIALMPKFTKIGQKAIDHQKRTLLKSPSKIKENQEGEER